MWVDGDPSIPVPPFVLHDILVRRHADIPIGSHSKYVVVVVLASVLK